MSNIRFNLNKNKNGSFTIFMIFRYDIHNIKISIREKIKKKDWDINKQLPKRSHFAYMELKDYLIDIREKTERLLLKLKKDDKVYSVRFVKKELNNILFKKKSDELSFYDHFANFIEKKARDPKRNPDSTRRYVTLFRKLLNYDPDLSFDMIDLEWYRDWVEWLENKNYTINYISSLTKGFKSFLSHAWESGYTDNIKWKSRRFAYAGKTADSIYLTIDELWKMYNTDYVVDGIQNAVWLFLIGAFTGLRYHDIISLDWDKNIVNENNIKYIKIKTSKTDETVAIPLHPIVKYIIDNVNIRSLTNPVLNRYLKVAGKMAGIDEDVFLEENKGGRSIMKKYKKYEKITTHTARRSFATNAYKSGIAAASIMKITGHKSERQFFEYIKITADENAIRLSKHKFFNTKLRKVD